MDARYKLLLLLGISLPYIIQFYYVGYYRFLFSLVSSVFGANLYSFSALMALLTIFTLTNRISKGPGALQDSLIIVPAIIIAKNVIVANPAVALKLPVTVELPPGIKSNKGINPKKLQVRIKIKYVVSRGVQN